MAQAKNPYKNLICNLQFMIDWPWQKGEKFDIKCNHLIKYDGRNLEVSGISFKGFQLGKVAVKPELLQTAGHALMLIDASQYHFCELVRQASDDETRRKYFQLMMDDRIRAQDVIMGLAALTISPESPEIEKTLMKMLLDNHNRALQLKEQKIEISSEPIEPSSPHVISLPDNTTYEDKINQIEKLYPDKISELEKAKTKSVSKFDHVGLLDLLIQRFNMDDLKVLVFRFTNDTLDFDGDIGGSTKKIKAVNLIQYFDRRQQLGDFYEFVEKEIASWQ